MKDTLIPTSAIESVAASQTDQEMVAAKTNNTIYLHGLSVSAAGTATDLTIKSKLGSASSVAIWGPHRIAATGVVYIPVEAATEKGAALVATTGTGATVTINYLYSLR